MWKAWVVVVCVKMRKMYLFLVAATALSTHFAVATKGTRASPLSAFPSLGREMPAAMISRKLKNMCDQSCKTRKDVGGKINMDDYNLVDPSPSAKAAIKSGPIEHGTPLIPYIPQPSPPNHPKHGGP